MVNQHMWVILIKRISYSQNKRSLVKLILPECKESKTEEKCKNCIYPWTDKYNIL